MTDKDHDDDANRATEHNATSIGRPNLLYLFLGLLALRLTNALTIKTFFQPDEFFQSLEPAWQSVFGKSSGAWITWEWREHLRSSIHPLLFAMVYRAADTLAEYLQVSFSLRAEILIEAPKIMQAGFAATTDLFTYLLASQLYGFDSFASLAALSLTVLSPWQWFASVRTLSNSLETSLTVVALYYWPWEWFLHNKGATNETSGRPANLEETEASVTLEASLIAAAVACILRPTNLIVWATISITTVLRSGDLGKATKLGLTALTYGTAVLAFAFALDFRFYGDWVFPPLRFLQFNVVQSLSVFYGKNKFGYYFAEGLPLLLTTALPFAVVGMRNALRHGFEKRDTGTQTRFAMALAVVTSVVTLSLIAHKEVRFIFPLLPTLHVLAAQPMATFFNLSSAPAKKIRFDILMIFIGLNVLIAGYAGYVHQRGVVDVVHYLRHEHEDKVSASYEDALSAPVDTSVAFFMPCHSTPWRSHLVYPEINAWALTCEPPLNLSMAERETYLDEADIFYANPERWIEQNMADRKDCEKETSTRPTRWDGKEALRPWPVYLVFFQQLEPTISELLKGTGYQECWRGFNTHWHDDWRREGDVVVWCSH